MRPSSAPSILVVSAPSGAGKTTLNRRLVTEHEDLVAMSVSYTTRARRTGEVDGVDYHYVTRAAFEELIHGGGMLEYAEVFGTLYGTARAEIERIQALGKSALLEIDVQGWRSVRAQVPTAQSVFILPPSIEALWQRLEARGTEPLTVRLRRLNTAKVELQSGHLYQHFVVNHTVEQAYAELQDIMIHGKNGAMSQAEGVAACRALVAEFDSAGWPEKLSPPDADKS
jgi:guanylate kinase